MSELHNIASIDGENLRVSCMRHVVSSTSGGCGYVSGIGWVIIHASVVVSVWCKRFLERCSLVSELSCISENATTVSFLVAPYVARWSLPLAIYGYAYERDFHNKLAWPLSHKLDTDNVHDLS